LFERIFEALLPQLKSRHEERKRPIAPSIQYGLKHFERIWAADGSSFRSIVSETGESQRFATWRIGGKNLHRD
jgi:hypothetical protein